MKRIIPITVLWLLTLTMQAQHYSIVDRYVDSLKYAMSQKNYELTNDYDVSPYYYQMFFPSTYYSNVTRNVFSLDSTAQTPMNLHLLRLYANQPSLVKHYDEQFKNEALLEAKSGSERPNDDIKKEINNAITSSSKDRIDKDDFDIGLQVVKPNFWKTAGNFSLKFTQNYFSENWYQGGNNSGTMLATLNLSAIYNDTKRIT